MTDKPVPDDYHDLLADVLGAVKRFHTTAQPSEPCSWPKTTPPPCTTPSPGWLRPSRWPATPTNRCLRQFVLVYPVSKSSMPRWGRALFARSKNECKWPVRCAIGMQNAPTVCRLLEPGEMELSFATRRLRSEALDRSIAERSYGLKTALELHARLADLAAAVTVADLPRVTGWETDDVQLRVQLSAKRLLLCVPVALAPPVDWSRTHRLQVLELREGL
jgi:hypothetical protein